MDRHLYSLTPLAWIASTEGTIGNRERQVPTLYCAKALHMILGKCAARDLERGIAGGVAIVDYSPARNRK